MSAPYSPPSPGGRARRSRTEHKLPSITRQLPDMFPPTDTPPLTPDSNRNPWNLSPSRQQKTRGSSYDSRKSSYQSSSSSGYHAPPRSMPPTAGKDRRQHWDSGEDDDDDEDDERYMDDMNGFDKPKLPSLKSLDLHSTDAEPWLAEYPTRGTNNVHPGRGTSATLQEHALSRQSMAERGNRHDPLSTTSATFNIPHDSAPAAPSSERYYSGPGGYSPSPSSSHRHSDHVSSQLIWESSQSGGAGSNPNGRKRRGNLPKESTNILNDWYNQHRAYPYPKDDEKQHLQAATGLSLSQISNWFINARRRRRPDSSSSSSYRTPELVAQQPPPTSSGGHDPYARYDPRTLPPR